MYRVLKPGGEAVIHDLRRDASPEAIKAAVKEMGLGWFNCAADEMDVALAPQAGLLAGRVPGDGWGDALWDLRDQLRPDWLGGIPLEVTSGKGRGWQQHDFAGNFPTNFTVR